MLKEAFDLLGAFKYNLDGECISVSNSTTSNKFGLGSNDNSPKRFSDEFFFEPNFGQENPFASDLTLSLMRNSSSEFLPSNQLAGLNLSDSRNFRDVFSNSFEQIDLPDVNLRNSSSIQQRAESCTGKFSPLEENKLFQFDLKHQKIERKRIQKAPAHGKRKVKKVSSSKKSKKSKKNKKDSKKDFKRNSVNDFKRESKNVVKNYGKAMAAFSLCDTATPYLQIFALDHGVSMEEFKAFMINRKETIDSIGSLRDLLCPNFENDSLQELRLKRVFRDISEIFVRDFAVNWIFTSKSQYKSALLNYRFKILRRVMDPANFTYLKSQ